MPTNQLSNYLTSNDYWRGVVLGSWRHAPQQSYSIVNVMYNMYNNLRCIHKNNCAKIINEKQLSKCTAAIAATVSLWKDKLKVRLPSIYP